MTELALAPLTTMGVGGPAKECFSAHDQGALVDAVRTADAAGTAVLILGGGSNVIIGDAGFPGVVILVRNRGIAVREEPDRVSLVIDAGEPWDEVVALAVAQGWPGIEALSGIPGLSGATVIQNVGAYGQDIAEVLSGVRALDRLTGDVVHLDASQCGLRYRGSRFKDEPHRWVVLSVTLTLRSARGAATSPVAYEQLAAALHVDTGAPVEIGRIRDAVLGLRAQKGMIIDPCDPESRSVGSFFTNPVLDPAVAAGIDPACPRYPDPAGVKLSAAWLIESAGIDRGFPGRPDAPARVSRKHVLALVNAGSASAADIVALAGTIRDRVLSVHGVLLEPEPTLVGCQLPDEQR